MFHPTPPAWAHALPGYGASRVLTDAAHHPGFHQPAALLIALAWPVGLSPGPGRCDPPGYG
ncbi:hypothetical protein [Streptomyces sp. NPDC018693]|uniref:hypothetical protein n=1 Tax=unclassified Streptomyces TaxID=2593676 RepID=UPI0037B1BBEC